MNFLKKLLYIIGGFCAILSFIVVLCAINPKWSTRISDFLYARQSGDPLENSSVEVTGNEKEEATSYREGDQTDVQNLKEDNSGIVSTFQEGEGYVAPSESEVKEPEDVAGKSGYQPIKDSTEVIEETEEEEISQSLSVGETGEGLDFDSEFYPYYAMLSEDLQKLYRQIYANAMALNDHFAPIVDVPMSQVKNAFTAVVCDHPDLFWVDTAYRSRYLKSGKCVDIQLQFNQTADNLTENKERFESKANEIISQAQGLGSDYDKEVYVHDALIRQVEYNLNAPMNQSAYSALINGQTVCAGYARAYQYLMQKLGIPCYYCMGYAGENHAWNIVSLEDGYYNVDATWNDTEPNTYHYFNKSDNDFSANHVRKDLSVYLPACNGQEYRDLLNATEEISVTENGRGLEDTGFSTQDVLYNLEDYYNNCYNQIVEKGLGSYSFQNVIKGNEVYQQMYEDYLNDSYKDGYADKVLAELGGSNFQISLDMEELQEGYLLLYHKVTMK